MILKRRSKTESRNFLTAGFTLIELMVTLAISAILIAIAVPGFQEMIQANRLQSVTAEFQSALALARAEAIKRGGDAKVTVLANTVGATTSWNNGYTVFVNRSAATTLAQLSAESTAANARGEQLMSIPVLNPSVNFTETSGPLLYVMYNGMGRSVNSSNGFLEVGYQFTGAAGAVASTSRCLMLNSMGRIRSERYSYADFAALSPANTCPSTN